MKKILTMLALAAVAVISQAQIVQNFSADGQAGTSAEVHITYSGQITWVETTWNLFDIRDGQMIKYGTFTAHSAADSVFTITGLTLGGNYKITAVVDNGSTSQEVESMFQTPTQEQTAISEVSASELKLTIHGSDFTATVGGEYVGGTLQVYNLQGQLVENKKITETNVATTITDAPGIYIVEILSPAGERKTAKVSKS